MATTLETCAPPIAAGEDRRIVRSKRALRDALIALMEERGYEAFTVNDLCARADLNRGTFYNHFRDKEDLLLTLEDEVVACPCSSSRSRSSCASASAAPRSRFS